MVAEKALDVIVVGAGPAGLWAARKMQQSSPDLSIMVLESGDKSLGRTHAGLHLVDNAVVDSYPLRVGRNLSPLKVRWERNWVDPLDVDWKSKEWIDSVPQWTLHMRGNWQLFQGFEDFPIEVPVKWQCPVSEIAKTEDTTHDLWKLSTPCGEYLAKQVYWAAGLTAFQNAYGKIAAQSFVVANPRFNEDAMEYRGGIAVEFEIDSMEAFGDDVPRDHLLAVPVRFESKLYLSFAAIDQSSPEKKPQLLTLTHLPREMAADPKTVGSFQKSLRRSMKALLREEASLGQEKWVLSPAIFGHVMGTRGIFGQGIEGSLRFLGDETLSAQSQGHWDLVSALDSVSETLSTSFEKVPGPGESFREDAIPRIVL